MDDIEQPGRPGPGADDTTPAGPPPPDPAQAPPMAAPPPPYAPPPPRRLTRSEDGRVIAGVAAGIGRHLGVDANLVRVVFAVLSFTGGVGFLLYLAGWLLLPSDHEPEAIGITWIRRASQGGWRAYLAVIIGACAIAALAGDLDPGHPGLVWGMVLLGLGVALLIREGDSPRPHPAPGGGAAAWTPPPPIPQPVAPGTPHTATGYTATGYTATASDLPPQAPPVWPAWPESVRQRRRRRSPMTRITLAAALLVAAGAGILGNTGTVDVSAQSALALCLVVVGAGLIAGSFIRPPRGLIGIGILLVPATLAAGISDVPLRGGAGDRQWQPHTVAQLGDGYQLGMGDLTVDLTRVPFGETATSVTARLGMGNMTVRVPDNVPLDIRAHVGAGDVRLLDRDDNGLDVNSNLRADGSTSVGRLTLDLRAGLGEIHVMRVANDAPQGAL